MLPLRLAFPRLAIDWRSPRLPGVVIAALGALVALALAFAWVFGSEAPLRYHSLPRIEGSVPTEVIAPLEQIALFGLDAPAALPPPLVGEEPDQGAPPLNADPALVEWRDGLALPQIAADGRAARQVYARSVPATVAERALVGIVVVDLGLDAERLEQSVMLPDAIGLAHTPYAANLAAWHRHARYFGHEVMLELPLEPADHPISDFGPWALRPTAAPELRLVQLDHVLGRSDAYFGLAAASEAFAPVPEAFTPVAAAIAERGLGLVELGGTRLAEIAAAAGLAYASAVGPLDAVPEASAIDAALGRLEGAALRDGLAVGYVQSHPLTFDRLWHWSQSLDSKGISLVPVSHLLTAP